MSWFRKAALSEPLPVAMAGVKLGDRVLVIGVNDVKLIAALAIKAGLTGRAAAVDADGDRVQHAARAVEGEGALAEVTRAPWGMWPYDGSSFDIAVVPNLLMELAPDVRTACLREVFRVLRPGGRVLVIEPAPRAGLGAIFSRHHVDPSGVGGEAKAALQASGFAGVRVLAERDGMLFLEGAIRS